MPRAAKTPPSPPMNTRDIRASLLDAMAKLLNREIDAKQAKAVAREAGRTLKRLRLKGHDVAVDVKGQERALWQAMVDAHPDKGGSHEAFIAARRKYVAAPRRSLPNR